MLSVPYCVCIYRFFFARLHLQNFDEPHSKTQLAEFQSPTVYKTDSNNKRNQHRKRKLFRLQSSSQLLAKTFHWYWRKNYSPKSFCKTEFLNIRSIMIHECMTPSSQGKLLKVSVDFRLLEDSGASFVTVQLKSTRIWGS